MPVYNPASDLDIKMSGTAGGNNHNKIIIWSNIVIPTVGNGFSFSIADAGFSEITNVQLTVESSSNSILSLPLIMLKSYTLTTVTVNLLVSGNVGVVLGGIIQGLTYATNLTGVKIHARIEGT